MQQWLHELVPSLRYSTFLVFFFCFFLERVYISFINLCWLSQEWDSTNHEADEGGSIPRRFTITPKATMNSTQHSCPVGPSFGGNTVRNLNPVTEHMATVLRLLICVVDVPGSNLIRETHYLEHGFCVFISLSRKLPE